MINAAKLGAQYLRSAALQHADGYAHVQLGDMDVQIIPSARNYKKEPRTNLMGWGAKVAPTGAARSASDLMDTEGRLGDTWQSRGALPAPLADRPA